MTQAITRYLPRAGQDEAIPEPQPSPDNFIVLDRQRGWIIRPTGEPDEDSEYYVTVLNHGDVIAFDENEVYGDFMLTVRDDRTFFTDRPVPEKANCFRNDRDIDTLSMSLKELVDGDGSVFSNDRLEPGTHDIDAWWWSEKSVYFRFCIDGPDKAHFEPCAGPA